MTLYARALSKIRRIIRLDGTRDSRLKSVKKLHVIFFHSIQNSTSLLPVDTYILKYIDSSLFKVTYWRLSGTIINLLKQTFGQLDQF